LGFLLATSFFVFGTLFGRKKVALLNPFRAAKPTGKLPPGGNLVGVYLMMIEFLV